jgi:hypothetical protein
VIFRVTSAGVYSIVKSFTTTESMSTSIGLDQDGKHYLGISVESATSSPSFFKLDAGNGGYQKLQTLPSNRRIYRSPLYVSSGHVWTYMDQDGGSQYIVKSDANGTSSVDIFSNSNSAQTGARVEAWVEKGGYVYALTSTGGARGTGTFFKMNIDGTGFTKLTDLPSDRPDFPVILRSGSDDIFYAMSATSNASVFFSLTKDGVFKKIKSFRGAEAGWVKDMLELPNGEFAVLNDVNGGSASSPASIFTITKDGIKTSVTYTFSKEHGLNPASFVRSFDGWFYIRTTYGGATGTGGVFRIRAD